MKITDKKNIKWINDFSEKMAYFRYHDQMYGLRYGFVNKKLEIKIENLEKVKPFRNGLAAFKHGNQWGFIDKNGKIKINPQYSDIVEDGFSERLCAVRRNKEGHYGYINKKGIFILNPIYTLAFQFHNGLAVVVIDNGFYLINKRGKFVSEQIASFTGL